MLKWEASVVDEAFPGGIRLVVLVQGVDAASSRGAGEYIVAYDGPNPNINWHIPVEYLKPLS